jgi:hypothetical protein
MLSLRAFVFLTCLIASAPASGSDEISLGALDDETYHDTRNGVVQLVCQDEASGQRYLSRAAVLSLPGFEAHYDILLATRHAVMDGNVERNCHIRGERLQVGQITRIDTSVLTAEEAGDFNLDWAIIRTHGRLSPRIPRLRAIAFDGEAPGQVSLLRASVETDPCTVNRGPGPRDEPALIFHDCFSRPGLSGSPLLVELDGEAFVIGIHIGEYIMLDPPARHYGVARRLNDAFLQALIDFIADESAG